MTIVEPMYATDNAMSLESSLLAYQPSESDSTLDPGPFCHVCSGSVLPSSLASRTADARWVSRIVEGYLTCHTCAQISHRKCTIGFKDMPYSLLIGDVYYEYTCPSCYTASTPLVPNMSSSSDSLFRYKLSMNEITLLILYHLSLTTDSNVSIHANELRTSPLKGADASTAPKDTDSANQLIKLFHWKTIRDHIVLNWYKLWNKNPNKGGPNGWESQLSSTLTNLSGVSFVNGKFMANAPGYFGLLPNVKPTLTKDILLAYRVGSKGELVKCPPLPSSRASSDSLASAIPTLLGQPTKNLVTASTTTEPISYWNTDFDLPNRPGPVSIHKHSDFTHPSHRIVEADLFTTPPRSCHTLSKQKGGYRMARASHGAFEGDWYYEIKIPEETGGHVRVGWSMILGDLHAPVGFDEYSYAYGNVTGHSFHTRKPCVFGPTFGPGDIIGVHLHLPVYDATPSPSTDTSDTETQARIEAEYPPLRLGEYRVKLKLHPGSFIAYYKNGSALGSAFGPIYRGKYYPACSVYQGDVDICFGPKQAFQNWPDAVVDLKAVTDMQDMKEAFDFEVNLTTTESIQKKRKQRHDNDLEENEPMDEEPQGQKTELLNEGHFPIMQEEDPHDSPAPPSLSPSPPPPPSPSTTLHDQA